MMRGCTAIMTRANRQAITRPMVHAISTAEIVWITRAIRSPTRDLTYNNNIMAGWMPPNTTALKLPINACFHSGALSISSLLKDGTGSFGFSVLSASPASPNDLAELDLLAAENLLLMLWLLDCPTADVLPATPISSVPFESLVC
uniref:Uncharacterized protein n=1 Tax=Leersia perrieri TaxID=77586 RepID=A0A0D9VD64_9ORYZ